MNPTRSHSSSEAQTQCADWEESEYVLVNHPTDLPDNFVIITPADVHPGPGQPRHQPNPIQSSDKEIVDEIVAAAVKADVVFAEFELEEFIGSLMTTGIFKDSEDSLPRLNPIKLQQIVDKLAAMGFTHPFRIDGLESADWIICTIMQKWSSGTSSLACLDDYFPDFVAFKSAGFDIEDGEGRKRSSLDQSCKHTKADD